MTEQSTLPKVWTWERGNGGQFANINRPISGPTHDKEHSNYRLQVSGLAA